MLHLEPAPLVDEFVTADRLNVVQEKFPIDLHTCQSCGHAQLLDIVDPGTLYNDYLYETATSPGLVDHFGEYASAMVDKVPLDQGSFVIDVGSNDGILLRFFKDRGMRVLGIDPAVEIARRATESGIETIASFLNPELAKRIRGEYGEADLVTANNVFAHADDLSGMADSIRTLLSQRGMFVFEVSYLLSTIQGSVFDFIYQENISHHSVKPLASFLQRHDMELVDVQKIPTKGGSLRGFAQPIGGPRKASPSVGEFVEAEERAGLYTPEIFRDWVVKIGRNRDAVVKLLKEATADGKLIVGYGASATTTVLTYHYGIGSMMKVLIDDCEDRQGLYSPGNHIPVVPASWIYENRPDLIVILAWRFSDLIVPKHQEYLDSGGHFVVPLPELRVI